MGKISEKIQECREKRQLFYSFEFFPPKTEAGVQNLFTRMDRMAGLGPLFCDITWGAGGTTSQLTVDIAVKAQKFCGLEMLMHLTCTNMPTNKIKEALDAAKEAGIRNILALRGDPPKGLGQWEAPDGGFSRAVDLVRYIRREYGDYFCIGVGGHPEKHPEAPELETDIQHLKEKVDAGGDFVISQLFYDPELFLAWEAKCREAGITVPIIPGIMSIQNYTGFVRMAKFVKCHVPQEVYDNLEPIKDNDEAVKEFGIQYAMKMCKTLLEGGCIGLHFYTLNLERSVRRILEGLQISSKSTIRELPWQPSTLAKREKENVRPIFWANRPHSYLHRTDSWDEFPNGRWGDNRSPAFGELSDSHYVHYNAGTFEEMKGMWGSNPTTVSDIYEVFAGYVTGKIPRLPWCEIPLMPETNVIAGKLEKMNRAGFLTINSQPRVNAARSDHPVYGWGGPDGYVYQKAYVECFVAPSNLKLIMEEISDRRSMNYFAADAQGNTYSNYNGKRVTAVTWGAFPNKEILQPTVVDIESFLAWKDEAFQLWLTTWGSIYPKGSKAKELIQEIRDTFFLVSIVDNDFISGDIWEIFDACMATQGVEVATSVPQLKH